MQGSLNRSNSGKTASCAPRSSECISGISQNCRRACSGSASSHLFSTQRQGLRIASEGHGDVAPNLAGELVQQEHQRQATGRLSIPDVKLTGDCPPRQAEKPFAQEGIEGSVLGEPLARSGFDKPERENLADLVRQALRHNSAWTLATLSSRVWSLSVRVLIFTVV